VFESSSPPLSVIAERLSRAELLGELSQADRAQIAQFCSERVYQDGDLLLREGEPADCLFIIERGKVALEKKIQIGRHSTARNATIGYVGPGMSAGFSCLASPHTYSTSGVCIEPARVIAVDGIALRSYLQENPAAGLVIMGNLATLIGDRYRHSINTLTYFLSVVSHELRSPLAAIENYLQTMLGGFTGDLTSKQERMMRRCLLRVIDLRALIGDVVDLARMRPEQIQADFEWFDPGEVGAESIEDVHLAAVEKGIQIKVEPPPRFEPIVGARRRMRQVFTNLLNNAIKFSPPDSTITFRAYYRPDALIFEVEDEGPGIPEEELEHIFKEFYRASNIELTQGMGLGLSIAQKIAKAHNGQITVENLSDEAGIHGTRFTVITPRNLTTPEMRRQKWLLAEEGDA
jgi:signal transduction histidine kinase